MTYTLLARDDAAGEFGVATTTGIPCVGALCPFVCDGAAVASQAYVNVDLGLLAMQRIDRDGRSVKDTLSSLVEEDWDRERRQVVGLGHGDDVYVHTGDQTLDWHGAVVGGDHVAAGNRIEGLHVLEAVSETFAAGAGKELTIRMIDAMLAGHAAGGEMDVTPGFELGNVQGSAAVIVASPDPKLVHNLRVDAHPEALVELRRVYDVATTGARAIRDFYAGAIELEPIYWREVEGLARA